MILAIDPGQTGALVWMQDASIISIEDMPITERVSGKGKIVNAYLLNDLIRDLPVSVAVLEKAWTRPVQGLKAAFNTGEGYGIIEGVLAANNIRIEYVTPQKWKKHCGLIGKDKDAARTYAISHYPEKSAELARKKDGGRADAICVGHWWLTK